MRHGFCVLLMLWTLSVQPQASAIWFVAPNGTPTGTGTIESPLDFTTATAANSPITACARVELRGGVYAGPLRSWLIGSASCPIIVEPYQDERVIFDGAGSLTTTLTLSGQYTDYVRLEITNSDPSRTTPRAIGVEILGDVGLRFINNVVHDTGQGIGSGLSGSQIIGNLVYNNGTVLNGNNPVGQGIYAQNRTTPALIADNLVFDNFNGGLQFYGSSRSFLSHATISGNVWAWNGRPPGLGYHNQQMLLGASCCVKLDDIALRDNYTYLPAGGPYGIVGGGVDLGYNGGCLPSVTDIGGVYVGYSSIQFRSACAPGQFQDHILIGSADNATNTVETLYPANTYRHDTLNGWPTTPPVGAGVWIYLRPDSLGTARGHLIVYNWDRMGILPVDLSLLNIPLNAQVTIRDAQNYFACPPLVQITYQGTTIPIPMAGRKAAAPVGTVPMPPSTSTEFGMFVVTWQ